MTTTPTDARQVNAFVDGELDLTRQLAMEEQLKHDPALREEVEQLRQLRQAIREHADYHRAPAALGRRAAHSVQPSEQAEAWTPSTLGAAVHRWLGWRPLVASLGAAGVLAVAINLALLRAAEDERLLDDVVASHVRSTLGQHLVDVASSDHHTVKPWLSSKLDFSPPVNELAIPGSSFLGARVDYLDGHPVAALVYRQGEHVVNAFVWPSDAKDSAPRFSMARGFQIAHWSQGGMSHWVVSDASRQEFGAVVAAIEATARQR